MGGGIPANVSQTPTDLGGGFEDPMDPCTMCQQGQMEIQQAYNDLTQTCNACQTQSNLKTLTSQGCQGCQQAQQVIQNVQNQAGGCSSCGATQNTMFQQMQPQMMPQQSFVTGQITTPMTMASQGLVQPMLTPLTGTGQQMLTTVIQQPGMQANQLPIAIERGPTPQQPYGYGLGQLGMPLHSQQFTQQQQPMMTTQPMVTGMLTQPTPMPMQPVVTGMISPPPQPMQPVVTGMIPAPPPAPVMQPVMQPIPLPTPVPVPVQQPVLVPQQPTIQVPQYSPAQIAAAQQIAQQASAGAQRGQLYISGLGGIGAGVGGGTGKAPVATVGQDVNTVVLGGSGYGFGGIGVSGVGGPGAFDTHRPDLHAGGGWHMTMPLGTEVLFNLL